MHSKFILALAFWTGRKKKGTGIGDKEDRGQGEPTLYL